MRIPVMVTNEDNEMIRATTRNISPDGLQLRCGVSAAQQLRPGGKQILANNGPRVMLRLVLPVNGRDHDFVAPARLTYLTPRDRDELAFGVRFLGLQPLHQQQLDAFIMEAMQPAEW